MLGFITGREVVFNAVLIYREFGFRCLLRCAYACWVKRARTTFLDIVFSSSPQPPKLP